MEELLVEFLNISRGEMKVTIELIKIK